MNINAANYHSEAVLHMRSVPPNADGTIGVMLTPDMPEWKAWLAYFWGKRFDPQAAFMQSRGKSGYMVPCRNPADFDPDVGVARQTYAERIHVGEVRREDLSRHSSQMTIGEREAVLARLGRLNPLLGKWKADDAEQVAA